MSTDPASSISRRGAMQSALAAGGTAALVGCEKGVQFRNVWLERLGE